MSETFVTIAQFTYSSEAKIIQGRLESDGIPTFLSDANTIDIDPFLSNAIGGVKLKIRVEDEGKAKNIFKHINKFSLTDEGEAIRCQNCNSEKIDFFSHVDSFGSQLALLGGFLSKALPIYIKYDYRCRECKTKFTLDE